MKVSDFISCRDAIVFEPSVVVVDRTQTAIVFDFAISDIVVARMEVFPGQEGVNVVKRGIKQHCDGPICLATVVKI